MAAFFTHRLFLFTFFSTRSIHTYDLIIHLQVRDYDPRAVLGSAQADAKWAAAGGNAALQGLLGRAASRVLLQSRRARFARLRRVGLPEHHGRQGHRRAGAIGGVGGIGRD